MADWRKDVIDHFFLACDKPIQAPTFSVHLAVFVEPFLQYIMDGVKTIETRFSVIRCAPYDQIDVGDRILLKRSGGPITAICEVDAARFYPLEEGSWKEIKKLSVEICADEPSFWDSRKDALFATLINIRNVRAIEPFRPLKRDRRGWVVLHDADAGAVVER